MGHFTTTVFIFLSVIFLQQLTFSHGQNYWDNDCLDSEFRCEEKCILKEFVCNGQEDCDNGDDELNCESGCNSDEFECYDRTCIDKSLVCNQYQDCNEGEDEENCEEMCKPSQFRCDSGLCIDEKLRCNGVNDCLDYSDENKCSFCNKKTTFKCSNGVCIAKKLRCDGKQHCNDGSDEINCSDNKSSIKSCMLDEFSCANGNCIPQEGVCDNVTDCTNGEDERENCVCGPNEFKCLVGGGCWPQNKVCDKNVDCWDKSDEHNCTYTNKNLPSTPYFQTCKPDEFLCSDGICISGYKRCNGIIDCVDKSDENHCSVRTYENFYDDDDDAYVCTADEFLCDYDTCILKSQVCDGTLDCVDKTDELNCAHIPTENCASHEFRCSNGLCIDSIDRCNGYVDCIDGSDEMICQICQNRAFHCRSGECVAEEKICDRIHDCNDFSDEMGCVYDCKSNEFRCSDGLCVNELHLCDGIKHCLDGSDELAMNCRSDFDYYNHRFDDTKKPAEPCGAGQWQCDNDQCINVEFVCDGTSDCLDESDEASVCKGKDRPSKIACGEYEFACDDTCIDDRRRCDEIRDCLDGTDEENCEDTDYAEPAGPTITTPPPVHAPPPSVPLYCPEHKCQNEERCFQESQRCDGQWDCSSGSDEQGCPPVCSSSEFQCEDGKCIPSQRHCDQMRDCRDGSDEWDCPTIPPPTCGYGQWKCSSGECIPITSRCDYRPDCRDYSDESNCGTQPTPYTPTESPRLNLKTYPSDQIIKESREVVFQCRDEGPIRARIRWTGANGRPLPTGSRDVNGRLEIPNIRMEHAGEYICEAVGYPSTTPGAQISVQLIVEKYDPVVDRPSTACSVHQATCMNGECIEKQKVCDGIYDCNDGSDETSCSKMHGGCEPNEFKCRNNKCVLKTWRCDGENDCDDNSDEESCATLPPDAPCRFDEFQCRSGQCVPKSFQCDTHADCIDNSDEIGCSSPTVAQPPPPMLKLLPGQTFNITCRAVGVPVPLIVWRLNWGHIPDKCITTSVDGYGVLTCHNIEVRDSGAYSCEIINSMGTHFVTPDTILIVSDNDTVCQSGYFNSKARLPEECINCFCFGVSKQCSSANLYTYSIPAPVTALNLVGIEGPWSGTSDITVTDFPNQELIATRHGVQLRLSNIPLSRQLPYYTLPDEYLGNQLKSYGGSFKYVIEYTGYGSPIDAPDIILIGNGYKLIHRSNTRIVEGIRNDVSVTFAPEYWYTVDGRVSTREEIMMALANVDHILIRLQYVDQVQREIELLNIIMDSAANRDMGLGSASLVEECRCPVGYVGLSCENCAHGYVRQQTGAWLGRCVREDIICSPGQYGDPNRGISCRPCPCPTSGNQFARTCSLGPDGDVICNCERGYVGRRCEECDTGYIGNPLLPGGSCQPIPQPVPSSCNVLGTLDVLPDGQCVCKEHVTGILCDQCTPSSFFLNSQATTGCIDCFCMGVTKICTSSSWYRDVVRSTFASSRNEFTVIADYENPDEVPIDVTVSNKEVVFRGGYPNDANIYYWRLPSRFTGNKITAYGGNLNYTIRYVPSPGGGHSRNTAPDVVIRSENDITILHYQRHEDLTPYGSQTYVVQIYEGEWERSDGTTVNREHLLMALADVSDIFIKATYTTTTDEAALSHVSLDIANPRITGTSARALEVEQCSCPPGHQGLSCEDCAPGYTRSQGGLYLGLCEPCDCNGHSDECDAETGECIGCRDNTDGYNCEECASGFHGNATHGSPNDCQLAPDNTHQCQQCDYRGHISCDRTCICKSNVGGYRCDQCREGTFNLQEQNPLGCSECFCSGATRSCTSSRLYRQQIPMIIFDDKFLLTNRDGIVQIYDEPIIDLSTNRLSHSVSEGQTYFWSLPGRFLGNQILSYGGNLTFTLSNVGYGSYIPDQDVIITGNGITLYWARKVNVVGTSTVVLKESEWQYVDRSGPRPATRADLLTVLNNIQSILIRATLLDVVTETSISDVFLDTAVQQHTGQSSVDEIEVCRCPPGYRGTSCESCDQLYYRDTYDRSIGLLGSCKRCPCTDNAESCSYDASRRVTCNCKPGYYGDLCESSGSTPQPSTPRPPQPPPTISVNISSPRLQIVDVGETIRISCEAFHKVKHIPIRVRWHKQQGHLPIHAYEEHGTLTIANVQIDDSGVYVCKAEMEEQIVEESVTITVIRDSESPQVTLSPPFIDTDEYQSAEVECRATGGGALLYKWERLNGQMSHDIYIEGGYLRFNSIRSSDAGDYRCTAENRVGMNSKILPIYVRDRTPSTARPEPPTHIVEIDPPKFNGFAGDLVQLRCTSHIRGTITWSKLGLPALPINYYVDQGVLFIENAQQKDSGTYICTSIASDTGATSKSTVDVWITIREHQLPPTIKQFNDLYTIIQGQDYSLNCEVSGDPYPKVKWTKVHEEFENNVQQSGNILRILNAQPANRGVYTCIAESESGSTEASTVIDIEPREAPVLELHPREPQTVRIGESAMLSCRAIAGIPPPSITWVRRDHRPLSVNVKEDYPGTIAFTDITLHDAGEYECRAENVAGTVSMTASLNVQQPPIVTLKPDTYEMTLTEGDELKLECSATGLPLPNVQWKEPYEQQQIAVAGFDGVRTHIKLAPYAIIQKYNVRKSDEGTYVCIAQNDAGLEEKHIYILVQPKRGDVGPHDTDDYPQINPHYRPSTRPPYTNGDEYPKTVHQYKVAVGDRSELSCQIQETNKPTSWRRRDGSPLPIGSHSSGGVLYIDTTTHDAAGFYECVVHEEDNTQYAIVITEVIVIELPRITFSPPMPMTVRSGENVVIYCNVTGEQPIRVQWHNENFKPLNPTINVHGNYLEFSHITPKDAGRYYCTAENIHGNVTKVAEVIVNRNEIIDSRPDQQGRVQEVIEGETVSLDCQLPNVELYYSPNAEFKWRRENAEIPETSQYDGNRLILHRLRHEDVGRYVCEMRTSHGFTEGYVDVVIKRFEMVSSCTLNDFHCKSNPRKCVIQSMVCDGIYDCDDHSDEMDCYKRRGYNRIRTKKDDGSSYSGGPSAKYIEAEKLPFLKLDPSRSYLRPGDSVTVDCTSSESIYTPVIWEKHGGQQLPYNFQQESNKLVIRNVQLQDAGRYNCKCYTNDGQLYATEYELNVEEQPPAKNEIRPPKVEHADVGSTVVLRCNSQKYPARFQWTRQHGHFATGQITTNSELRLIDVQAKDAGTYICTANHNGHTVDIPTTLVVVGAIPYFPQAPKSFMVFPKFEDAYMKFNFEITFKPERENGLILYNGQTRGVGDFISLSLNDAYPEFRFEFGNGPAIIRSEKPIEMGAWHTIKVNRMRRDGFMIVDDQRPVAFPTSSSRLGLDLIENLYLGGVSNFDDIAPSATATKAGFVGCISRLRLKEHEVMLNQESIFVEGVTSCEPCADEPCLNDGVCLESQTENGYTCVCQQGFTGKNCAVEGDSCSPGICGTGRCDDTEFGIICYCPLNKTGDRCQYIEHLDERSLSFKDGSFAAYKTPKSSKLNIKFKVRPENTDDSVILYVAESEHANGDFATVIIKDKHYEFRLNTGARLRPVIIRSAKPVIPNKWTDITIGRRLGEGYLKVGDQPQVTGKSTGPARSMYLKTSLYVGGYDKRILLNKGVDVNRGFDGCISGLEISNQKVDMVKDMLNGANVENCGDTNDVFSPTDDPSRIIDVCLEQDPCDNNGICTTVGNSFKCDCPIGFVGDICQHSAQLHQTAHFKGDGYIELNQSALITNSEKQKDEVLIAILLSTTQPNALVLWFGPEKDTSYNGQDFLAVAIVDGFVEYSFRLDNEESSVKDTSRRVDDGIRHVIIIRRNGNQASVEVDGYTTYGESRPTTRQKSKLNGHIFIGGAPDMINFTGNRFSHGFQGCIHVVEGSEDGSIDLGRHTISGMNVDTCPENDEEIDLGTDPPVV